MAEPAFKCIGYTPIADGLSPNCGNCKNYIKEKCSIRDLLDELYEESPRFRAYDMMMRTNKGINFGSS